MNPAGGSDPAGQPGPLLVNDNGGRSFGPVGSVIKTAGGIQFANGLAPGTAGTAGQGSFSCTTTQGGQSFTPATPVLLPGGKTAPIATLKPGDKVEATNTKTGKTQPETVTAVQARHDTDLYNLKVKTPHGTHAIHTTSNHLFYDPSLDKFIPAGHLKKGEHLKTPNGTLAVADGGATPKVHDAWMWDLTVQDDHDFYVLPADTGSGAAYYVDGEGVTAVLVHNINNPLLGCPTADGGMYGRLQPAGSGKQINHMPADWSTGSLISKYGGPALRMDAADHRELYTTGSSLEAQAWRGMQRSLIAQGRIDDALQMDINDVTSRFPGKYDKGLGQLLDSLPHNGRYQALRTVARTVFFQSALF